MCRVPGAASMGERRAPAREPSLLALAEELRAIGELGAVLADKAEDRERSGCSRNRRDPGHDPRLQKGRHQTVPDTGQGRSMAPEQA